MNLGGGNIFADRRLTHAGDGRDEHHYIVQCSVCLLRTGFAQFVSERRMSADQSKKELTEAQKIIQKYYGVSYDDESVTQPDFETVTKLQAESHEKKKVD